MVALQPLPGPGQVDEAAVVALLRVIAAECEGVCGSVPHRDALPSVVAGYLWPDDMKTARDNDGRAPLALVLERVRAEVERCEHLARDEQQLLFRRYGLVGAVTRIEASDRAGSLSRRLGPARSRGRVGDGVDV